MQPELQERGTSELSEYPKRTRVRRFRGWRWSVIAATLVMPLATLPLNGCLLALRPPGPPSERDSLVARQLLNLTLNAYWQAAMRNRPGLAVAVGDAPAMLPWLGEATARRNAQLAMRLQPALAEVDVEALSPRHYLLLQALDRELAARLAAPSCSCTGRRSRGPSDDQDRYQRIADAPS